MKKHTLVLLAAVITFAGSAFAQPGRMGGGGFTAVMTKLFGANKQFSADLEVEANAGPQGDVTMPGKMYFDGGKTRFEMNISDAKGGQMNPAMMQQMKAMGMDKTVVITRPDTKLTYAIYPGLNAYAETPIKDEDAKTDADVKMDKTKLGEETVGGHPTVKYKIAVTDDQNEKHEITAWEATDLKDFPVKIQTNEGGHDTTMSFSNIKTSKPDAALFDPPSGYTKYTSQREMMQQEMMKHMQGMQGMQGMHPGGAAPGGTPPASTEPKQ